MSSGTSALEFAYRSLLGIVPDVKKKIVIPAVSFVATLNSVLEARFEPSFCDVDPESGLIDIGKIADTEDSIAAITAVNLFGNMANYEKIEVYRNIFSKDRVPVIEDAAQSFGSFYNGIPSGKFGDVSCLSFNPTKNLSCYGNGGMVLTDDDRLAYLIKNFRYQGNYSEHYLSGTNNRMSEVECAQLLVKLKYFDQWQRRRQEIAKYYTENLKNHVTIPPIDDNVQSSWHKFVIHVPSNDLQLNSRWDWLGTSPNTLHHESNLDVDFLRRENRQILVNHLNDVCGIETKLHYPTPLHLLPTSGVSTQQRLGPDYCPNAEHFSYSCVSLPIYPYLTDAEVELIVKSIVKFIDSCPRPRGLWVRYK